MAANMFTVCRDPQLPECKALVFSTAVQEFLVQELQAGLNFEEIECVESDKGHQLQYIEARDTFVIAEAFKCQKFYVYGIVNDDAVTKQVHPETIPITASAPDVASTDGDFYEKPEHNDMFNFLATGVYPSNKITAKQRQNWMARSKKFYSLTQGRQGQRILWFKQQGETGNFAFFLCMMLTIVTHFVRFFEHLCLL
jgi:hypothetical protein